jgi:Domain of unknown function (DUF4350)
MKTPRTTLLAVFICAALIAILPGCGSTGPETEYGLSRGGSLNGTSAMAELLRSRGHTVRAAVRLTDTLAEWAGGMVRFAPYPGPPEADEARWLAEWLDEDLDRWLIYVVRDFDAGAEYWREIRDGISESAEPERRAEAETNRMAAEDWVHRLPQKPKKAGNARDWFAVESGASVPKICTKLEGPWADGIDAASAALWLHEGIVADRRSVLLYGDGKPLVVDKSLIGERNILIVANGSFLLNEALVSEGRRSLALRVAEWPLGGQLQIAFVEGSFVLSEEAGMPSLWQLMERLPPFRWVAGQMAVAALVAALARAPRLGRPRPDPPSGADRPAAHAEALGALLEASRSQAESLDLLERYRLWRWPHGARGPARGAGGSHKGGRAASSGRAAPQAFAAQKDSVPGSAKPAELDPG